MSCWLLFFFFSLRLWTSQLMSWNLEGHLWPRWVQFCHGVYRLCAVVHCGSEPLSDQTALTLSCPVCLRSSEVKMWLCCTLSWRSSSAVSPVQSLAAAETPALVRPRTNWPVTRLAPNSSREFLYIFFFCAMSCSLVTEMSSCFSQNLEEVKSEKHSLIRFYFKFGYSVCWFYHTNSHPNLWCWTLLILTVFVSVCVQRPLWCVRITVLLKVTSPTCPTLCWIIPTVTWNPFTYVVCPGYLICTDLRTDVVSV